MLSNSHRRPIKTACRPPVVQPKAKECLPPLLFLFFFSKTMPLLCPLGTVQLPAGILPRRGFAWILCLFGIVEFIVFLICIPFTYFPRVGSKKFFWFCCLLQKPSRVAYWGARILDREPNRLLHQWTESCGTWMVASVLYTRMYQTCVVIHLRRIFYLLNYTMVSRSQIKGFLYCFLLISTFNEGVS